MTRPGTILFALVLAPALRAAAASAPRPALEKVSAALGSRDFEAIVAVTEKELSAAKADARSVQDAGDERAITTVAEFEALWNRCRDIAARAGAELPLEDAAWAQANLSADSFDRLMSGKLGEKTGPMASRSAAPAAPSRPRPAPEQLATAVRASAVAKVSTNLPPPAKPAAPAKALLAALISLAAAGLGGLGLLRLGKAAPEEIPPLSPRPEGR